MNALTLLTNDHKRVDRLFAEHKQVQGNPRRQKAIFDRVHRELDIHAQIEEQIFYPALEGPIVTPLKPQVEEALAEHEEVKALLKLLAPLAPEDAGYPVEFTKLTDAVRRHVAEEESELFPAAREILGVPRLEELGREMTDLKQQLGPSLGAAVTAAVRAVKRTVRTAPARGRAKATARRPPPRRNRAASATPKTGRPRTRANSRVQTGARRRAK